MKRKLKKELLLMNMEANVIITKTSSFYNSATSNKGESYILRKGTTWTDMSMGGKKIKTTNACIKGFSRLQDETRTINVDEIRLTKIYWSNNCRNNIKEVHRPKRYKIEALKQSFYFLHLYK